MKEAWEKIHGKIEAKNQFMRETWFRAWCVHNENSDEWDAAVHFDAVTSGDDHAAVVPYAFQKKGPLEFASLAGEFVPRRGIPNTGLNSALISETAQRITEIKDVVGFRFGFVEVDDPFVTMVSEELKNKGWLSIIIPFRHDYGMAVPVSEDDYLAGISKNRKKTIARRRRKFEQAGQVDVKHFTDEDPETWKKIFKDVEAIEKNSWVAKWGECRMGGAENQKFWNMLITDPWFSQAMKVSITYFDGVPVSHYLSFDTDDTRYVVDTSYDEKVSEYGVGVMMEVENTKQCIRAGLKYINDSYGSEGFKIQWGRTPFTYLHDIIVFSPTLKGYLAYMVVKAKVLADGVKAGLRNIKAFFSRRNKSTQS